MPPEPGGQGALALADRGAVLSDCGRYRYALWRTWGSEPPALFVMLNPSIADSEVDDPTIRRCFGFAKRWGHGGLLVANLYAYRATDPRELDTVDDPIGPDTDEHLAELAERPDIVVAAWGASLPRLGNARVQHVLNGPLYDVDVRCLGRTKGGHPRHPLYVRGDVAPEMLWAAGTGPM